MGVDAHRAGRLAELYTYYRRANVHQDEERALFPAVISQDLLSDGMIERLVLDHEEIKETWRVLEIVLNGILEHFRVPEQLKEKAVRFDKFKREHLLRENEDFVPRLEKCLDTKQRQTMGQVMAAMLGGGTGWLMGDPFYIAYHPFVLALRLRSMRSAGLGDKPIMIGQLPKSRRKTNLSPGR